MADLTITDASVVPGTNAAVVDGTAGAACQRGEPVYADSTDSDQLKPCDADALASSIAVGIALNQADDEQPIRYQTGGNINLGATLTVGEVYAVSTTNSGRIGLYSDLGSADYVTILGVATSTSNLALKIQATSTTKP